MRDKFFATEKLNIFAAINFREFYQLKYFAVPNFRYFFKVSRDRETLFLVQKFYSFFIFNFQNLCRQVIINRQHTLKKSAEVIIFFFCILSDLDRIQNLRDNDFVSEAHLGLCQTSMMDFFYGNSQQFSTVTHVLQSPKHAAMSLCKF